MPIRDGRQVNIGGPKPNAVEIVGRRTETQVVFDNLDGTHQYLCFGSPVHYHDGTAWQPIDNRWQTGIAPWDYQMTAAQYQAYALRRFDAGRIVRLEKSGHYVTYQPMALNWSNDLDQIQQIAIPQNVQGVVTEYGADSLVQGGEIKWTGAYGTGLDFTYTPSTHFFQKMLAIDTLTRVGTPQQYILDGGNPCLQMSLVFASDLDLWVDGAKWDKKTQKDTASIVEFKDAAGVVHWWWRVPSATGVDGERVQGALRLKKQGASLYVSVQIPWSWLASAAFPVRVDPDIYYGATTDGYIEGYNWTTYSTAHNTSTSIVSNAVYLYVGQTGVTGVGHYCWRSYVEFNTSGIDDSATITQANLYISCAADHSVTDFIVRVHEYIWTSPLAAGTREADYDGALAATENAVTWKDTADVGFATNTPYASENLRAAYIDKTGAKLTQYALVSAEDIAASDPGATNAEYLQLSSQEYNTQAQRPYLSITVQAGGITVTVPAAMTTTAEIPAVPTVTILANVVVTVPATPDATPAMTAPTVESLANLVVTVPGTPDAVPGMTAPAVASLANVTVAVPAEMGATAEIGVPTLVGIMVVPDPMAVTAETTAPTVESLANVTVTVPGAMGTTAEITVPAIEIFTNVIVPSAMASTAAIGVPTVESLENVVVTLANAMAATTEMVIPTVEALENVNVSVPAAMGTTSAMAVPTVEALANVVVTVPTTPNVVAAMGTPAISVFIAFNYSALSV